MKPILVNAILNFQRKEILTISPTTTINRKNTIQEIIQKQKTSYTLGDLYIGDY